jgi:transcriptional regulator with XRE-family HTH domain
MERIGDHIRKRRLDLGLTPSEAAGLIGVSPVTLRGWERGARTPRVRHIPAVIRFLRYVPFSEGATPGEKYLAERRARGLTRREFAQRVGVDVSTVWRWEKGRTVPGATVK